MGYPETEEEKAEWNKARRDVLNQNLNERLLRDCCQDSCPVCVAFRNLAHALLDEDCTVCITQNQINPHGRFEPGMIHVNRHDELLNADGTRVELSVLAHEAGHWRSFKEGLRHPMLAAINEKRNAAPASLSAAEKLVIIEEEELAWRLGRGLLLGIARDLPMTFWEVFANTRKTCLATYHNLA